MIKKLKNREFELTMLSHEFSYEYADGFVRFEFSIGEKERGVILHKGIGSYSTSDNCVAFSFDEPIEDLTKQEKIIMEYNLLDELFLKQNKDGRSIFYNFLTKERLRLITHGFSFDKEDELKAKMRFIRRHYIEETRIITMNEFRKECEKARLELTYFNKHSPTRKDILDFVSVTCKAETTSTTYRFALEKFFEYVMTNHYDTYPKFNELTINEFIQKTYRIEKKSSYYVNRLVAAVLSFADYMGEIGKKNVYLDKDLNRKRLHIPKVPRLSEIKPRSLSDDQIERAEMYLMTKYMKAEFSVENGRWGYRGAFRDTMRNLFLFRVMLYGGLRIGEAIGLDFDDVHLGKRTETSYFLIRGKGNKERRVPILKEIREDLKNYIEWRKENDIWIEWEKQMRHLMTGRKSYSDYLSVELMEKMECIDEEIKILNEDVEKNKSEIKTLVYEFHEVVETGVMDFVQESFNSEAMQAMFVSNRSKRVSHNTIQVMFNELGKQKRKNDDGKWEEYDVGICSVSAHELRHTCIKNLVDTNTPINIIQLFSGHETADMVMRYSKPSFEEMANEIEKSHRKKE